MSVHSSDFDAESDFRHLRGRSIKISDKLTWVNKRRKQTTRASSVPSHSRSPLEKLEKTASNSDSDSCAVDFRGFIYVFKPNSSLDAAQVGLAKNALVTIASRVDTVSGNVGATFTTSTPIVSEHSSQSSLILKRDSEGGSENVSVIQARLTPPPTDRSLTNSPASPTVADAQRLDECSQQPVVLSSHEDHKSVECVEYSSPDWPFWEKLSARWLDETVEKHVETDCDSAAGSLQFDYSIGLSLGLQKEVCVDNNLQVSNWPKSVVVSAVNERVVGVAPVRDSCVNRAVGDIVELNGGYDWDALCRKYSASLPAAATQQLPDYPYKPRAHQVNDINIVLSTEGSAPPHSSLPAQASLLSGTVQLQSVQSKIDTGIATSKLLQIAPPSNFDTQLLLPIIVGGQTDRPASTLFFNRECEAFKIIEKQELKQQDPAWPEQKLHNPRNCRTCFAFLHGL